MVEDYKVDGRWMQTYLKERTRSMSKWRSMIDRCRAINKAYATYAKCSVSEAFLDFQAFTDWHVVQVGYGSDYHLDKDLLVPGNEEYSPGSCVLLPQELNLFIRPSVSRKGNLPQGVSFDEERGKYVAGISLNNASIYVGRFDTEREARMAYCEVKDSLASEWVKRLLSKEFVVDERVILAMKEWNTDARYD